LCVIDADERQLVVCETHTEILCLDELYEKFPLVNDMILLSINIKHITYEYRQM